MRCCRCRRSERSRFVCSVRILISAAHSRFDFGGKQASAASSGIIDGVGYLGAVLAGDSVARVAVAFGWQGVFVALAAVSAVAAVGAALLYVLTARAAATHGRICRDAAAG